MTTSSLILLLLIVFLPLLSFMGMIGTRSSMNPKWAWLSTGSMGISTLASVLIATKHWHAVPIQFAYPWITLAGHAVIDANIYLDHNTFIMLGLVTGISFCVHLYSMEYKKGDRHYHRYFGYLGIFTFSMICLLLAQNLLTIFVFWELVGFCSYLLIGFWFDKEKAVQANKKAFIVNRVADVFMIAGMMLLYQHFGTLNLASLHTFAKSGIENIPMSAGICLFIGCAGKSAQFPFQVWLPDAMEGPTPVSALIHAATMVAAGVYLMVRISFMLGPELGNIIAFIGLLTSLLGAFCALTQNDLKKVLAYSTISQLGMMMMGIGSLQPEAAMFHLVTHAFFKACLFLSAGSVIHAFHHVHQALEKRRPALYFDKQDMRSMGGVAKSMPWTCLAFCVSAAALIGVPFTSGFISKDQIITSLFERGIQDGWAQWMGIGALLVVLMTAFYTSRMVLMVFAGKPRYHQHYESEEDLHESSWYMLSPMLFLALGASFLPFASLPFGTSGLYWIHEFESNFFNPSLEHSIEVATILLSSFGMSMAFKWYGPKSYLRTLPMRKAWSKQFKTVYALSYYQFFLDRHYDTLWVKSTKYLAKGSAYIDKEILDPLLHSFAIFQVVLAKIIYKIDEIVVDGMVIGFAKMQGYLGQSIRMRYNGQVQQYIQWTLLVLMIVVGSLWLMG